MRWVTLALLLGGCFFDRSGLAQPDAAIVPPDGGRADAARTDACIPSTEICDGIDNDCDPSSPDGSEDPQLGTACDGADLDSCQDDAFVMCTSVGLGCSVGSDSTELCNGADDDCDGTIDEDASCPCRLEHFAGHAYLFCAGADWYTARDGCPTGYALAKIDSPEEQAFVAGVIAGIANVDVWIGATDEGMPTDYRWIMDNSEVPNPGEPGYQNWGNLDATGDCVELDGDMSVGPRWSWNDTACLEINPYVCETPSGP